MKSITILILGGTGDLTRKKLLPAINVIAKKGIIGGINVVAIGRRDFSAEDYHAFAKISELNLSKHIIISYFKADFAQKDSLAGLPAFLKRIEKNCIGRIFYLATSPVFFRDIASQLSKYTTNEKIFNRIMIEKPFGHDLKSSQELNKVLVGYFPESQIYRVDHYLGKETVQNILILRFSNPFFEQTWNTKFIEKIVITVSEDGGVGERLGYYDNAGAIRDMIQNHLMQMASFILMYAPASIDASHIHAAKVSAINHLRFDKEIIIGQYEGYHDELRSIGKEPSNTETFVELILHSTMQRWKNTAIILNTGKHLDRRHATIELFYRKEPCVIYCSPNTAPNKLVLNVQPIQDIEFYMNTKMPKHDPEIKQVKLNFCTEREFQSNSPESYETILEECINGNKALFISNSEIEAAWRVIDEIHAHIKGRTPLIYKRGSKGPERRE